MTQKEFLHISLEDKQFLDETANFYIWKHNRRFYNTYKFALSHLKDKPKPRILSIGSYFGTIEKMLKKAIDAEVTVVDYPDTITLLKPYYDYLGFKYIGIDLSQGLDGIPENYFD